MIMNSNNKYIINYVFLLLPISFILGAAIVELSFFIFLILTYLSYKKKFFTFEFREILFFFFIFYIYLNLNSVFSVEPIVSYKKSLPYFRFFLFIMALVCFLNSNPRILLKKKKTFFLFNNYFNY